MLKVGLTGGIGSGKSEVAGMLLAHGATLIDSDRVAREVVEPGTEGLAAVVAEFGPEVLTEDGRLDRPKLGGVVFQDPRRRHALNAIVHPLVRRRAAELESAAPPGGIVVHDVPLLVENAMEGLFDVVVVVDTPPYTQVDRLVRLRGMTPDDARARLAAQASRDQRRAAADVVIDNDGSLATLRSRVDELWRRLTARAAGQD